MDKRPFNPYLPLASQEPIETYLAMSRTLDNLYARDIDLEDTLAKLENYITIYEASDTEENKANLDSTHMRILAFAVLYDLSQNLPTVKMARKEYDSMHENLQAMQGIAEPTSLSDALDAVRKIKEAIDEYIIMPEKTTLASRKIDLAMRNAESVTKQAMIEDLMDLSY